MRVVLLSIFCALAFIACQNKDSKTGNMIEEAMRETEKEVELIGADVDSHGCERSAGYTWSQLRDDCIRIFDEGITLLPVDIEESEAVYAAFILYSKDKTEMELFLPSEKESILLKKTVEDVYEKGGFKFQEKTRELYINEEVEYKEDKVDL